MVEEPLSSASYHTCGFLNSPKTYRLQPGTMRVLPPSTIMLPSPMTSAPGIPAPRMSAMMS